MSCRVLFFDTTDYEKKFFENNDTEGLKIDFFDFSINNENLHKLPSQDFDSVVVICINENSEITPEIINSFKNLRLISTRSEKYSHINLPACLDKNIAVTNVPQSERMKSIDEVLTNVLNGMSGYFCAEKEYRII